jgi:hypothetical protein
MTIGLAVGAAAAAPARDGAGPPASALVLAASDVPGAKEIGHKADKPNRLIDGDYERVLRFSKPYGASKLATYDSAAILAHTLSFARQTYAQVANLLRSRTGVASLLKAELATLVRDFGGSAKGLTATGTTAHLVALGDGGLQLTAVIHQTTPKRAFSFSYTVFRVDRVIETGAAFGPATRWKPADAVALARLVLARVHAALSPVVATPPVVSGTAGQGQTLSATPGTWTNAPTSFAYRWQRCDAAGASCADIAGAASTTYAVTVADVGSTLRVDVTAKNGLGSAAAPSAVTVEVT